MSQSEVILTIGATTVNGFGVTVDVIGTKSDSENISDTGIIGGSVFTGSQGGYRKPPFPSTSLKLDDAIIFFNDCINMCKRIKEEMGLSDERKTTV